jgi:hypothetical protein
MTSSPGTTRPNQRAALWAPDGIEIVHRTQVDVLRWDSQSRLAHIVFWLFVEGLAVTA